MTDQDAETETQLQPDGELAEQHKRAKGIYLLPNLLTTGAMFAGFYAILASIHGSFQSSAIAIFVAMAFDGLDGRVARMTNTQSDFGVQYDSLSDMVSFGMAPAIITYNWMLNEVGKIGWAAAFVFASCAALRLARFNIQSGYVDKRYFVGLASPPAASILAGMVWSGHTLEPNAYMGLLASLVTILAGLLMVSNFQYLSFKDIDFKGKVPFVVILAIAMGFAFITLDPPRILLAMAVCYALSGPIGKLRKKKHANV